MICLLATNSFNNNDLRREMGFVLGYVAEEKHKAVVSC